MSALPKSAANPREVLTHRVGGRWCGRFSAMASPCELLTDEADAARARELAEGVAAIAWRVEDKYSRYRAGNIVDRINSSNGRYMSLDVETARLIEYCDALFRMSDGAFDITSGALRRAWHFDGSDRLPDAASVAAARRDIGWQRVDWDTPNLRLDPGMQIDLGGVGKEYAVDLAADWCREQSNAGALVNFGGDLAVARPRDDGEAWLVGVEGETGARHDRRLRLREGALATSGDSRRYLQRNGVRYSHILDPRTGWPVRDAPASVTVLAPTCSQAGSLATLASLQGAGAKAFLEEAGYRYWIRSR